MHFGRNKVSAEDRGVPKNKDVTNVMTAIDNTEYIEWDMDRLYDEILSAESLQTAVETTLDDLLSALLEMAFLKGIQFQRKMDMLINTIYE